MAVRYYRQTIALLFDLHFGAETHRKFRTENLNRGTVHFGVLQTADLVQRIETGNVDPQTTQRLA